MDFVLIHVVFLIFGRQGGRVGHPRLGYVQVRTVRDESA